MEFVQANGEKLALRNTVKAMESRLWDQQQYIASLERKVEKFTRRVS